MSTRVRLTAFVGAAALVVVLAAVAGRAIGPDLKPVESRHTGSHAIPASTQLPGGLLSYGNGYGFTLAATRLAAGRAVPVGFTIVGSDGRAVTSYDLRHDKQLHLVAVRRDFTGFQHVHPTLTDGRWSTTLDLTPGAWRLFADFKPAGKEALTLGTDLMVAGTFQPASVGPDSRTAEVDGYRVTLAGDLVAGAESTLRLSVSRAGQPITDLDPYLAAYGHLVALRDGDFAYLHVHPDGSPSDGRTPAGPVVVFQAEVPGTGSYHLYFDFKHRGVVRTAAFIVTVPTAAAQTEMQGNSNDSSTHH